MNTNFTLEIEPLRHSNDIIQHNQVDVEMWNYCISNQFPISIVEKSDGQNVILMTGHPHQGYTIQTQMRDGKLNGDATIMSPGKITIAIFQYVDNEITGECELYYDSGELFFEGSLKNGFREGFGIEYDKNGNELFIGWFEKGNRKHRWERINGDNKYWAEMDENGKVKSIYQMIERKGKGGFNNSFFTIRLYQGNMLSKNKELSLRYRFENENMIEYKNGVKCFEGTYDISKEKKYVRKNGKEYDETGENVIYCGEHLRGKRHGYGISYNNGEKKYEGEWVNGLTKPKFINFFIVIPIVFVICCAALIRMMPLDAHIKFVLYYLLLVWLMLIYMIGKYYLSYFETIVSSITPKINGKISKYQNGCLTLKNYIRLKTELFKINGLSKLKSLKIGRNCYNEMKRDYYNHYRNYSKEKANIKLKTFHILNCESLESIQIGEFSFSDFGGEFELSNLKSLKSIHIGTLGSRSYNFYFSSFVIRGMDMILTIE